MNRLQIESLVRWKKSPRRKPLILTGARKVGKTWLLKEFGRLHFQNVVYLNFELNAGLAAAFEGDLDIGLLVRTLSVAASEPINPETTLVILDEIQLCPRALTSLKYFCEQAPEYAVAAAGSFLGVTGYEGTGYPVGKVDSRMLHPLSWREYLDVMGQRQLREFLDEEDLAHVSIFHDKLVKLLREYFFVGGMPEVVSHFSKTGDFQAVRRMQLSILEDYSRDMAKNLGAADAKAAMAAFNSVPVQLGKENKRFVFGDISERARARQFRSPLTWLECSGFVIKVPRASTPGLPLAPYVGDSSFKCFMVDIGLLGAAVGVESEVLIGGSRIFTEFNGAMTEQFVCQELIADCGFKPYYWSAQNSRGKIDFLVQRGSCLYPIEVKAEENLNSKSLAAFSKKFSDTQPRRFSLARARKETWMENIPLYAVGVPKAWARPSG